MCYVQVSSASSAKRQESQCPGQYDLMFGTLDCVEILTEMTTTDLDEMCE